MSPRLNDLTAQSDAVLSWLRQREDEIAALLADLVAIPTENPPGKNYRACVDLLETHLRQVGLDCERLGPSVAKNDAEDSPESLLATHGSGERALYFHGHYDVVPSQVSGQFQPERALFVRARLRRHEGRNRCNALCNSRAETNRGGPER